MSVTKSQINNITSPNGNSLAVFIEGVTGEMLIKDINGNVEPISNYVGTPSPFEYGSCDTAIQPILGNNNSSGNYAVIGGGSSNLSANNHTTIGGGQCNSSLGRNSVISGGCLNISGVADCCLQTAQVTSSYFLIIDGGYINGSVSCVSPSFNYLCLNGNQTNNFIASGAVTYYGLTSPQGSFYCNTPTSGLNVTSACYNIGNSQTYIGLSPNLPSQFLVSSTVGTTIGGGQNNQALKNFSTISGGLNNKITGYSCYSTISGGCCNTICASSSYSIIGGGVGNSITGNGYKSTILGGWNNTISAGVSTINGGYKNIASANASAVLSGKCNIASCVSATVISGYQSVASGVESLVGGGAFNKGMAFASAVIGGRSNTVCCTAYYSGIFGGNGNTITNGTRSVIIGGNINEINSSNSAILGGGYNKTCGFNNVTIIGSNICATQSCATFVNCISAKNLITGCGVQVGANGVLIPVPTTPSLNNIFIIGAGAGSTLRCGLSNQSSGACSAVLGGKFNCALGTYGIVGGGSSNVSNGINSIVGGGQCNQALCEHSFVGGGYCNISSNIHGAVGGGAYNRANGAYSSILGGRDNNACNFACAMIIGSNLCATQACTTFMNCASAENLTVGCFVCVGTNKVLQNAPFTPVLPRFGSFFSNQNQCATAINTPKAVTLNNTDIASDGISIVNNSEITVDTAGVYNLQFSAQISRITGGTRETLTLWYKINGVQASNTSTGVTVQANADKLVIAWNFYIPLTAGQNVQLFYSTTDVDIMFLSQPENLTVPYPAIPSFIVTMNKIS